MDVPNDLYPIFTAEIESGRTPVISVPQREIRDGDLEVGEKYRIAVLPPVGNSESAETQRQQRTRVQSDPPVDEGKTLEVEIEDIGDKGDGLARIGPGYVIFVPGTEVGDRVKIEITEARQNFAFGEVVESEPVSG